MGRIKGITVEIDGNVTGLEKALKDVNSTIKTTQSELKDIERLLKLDPSTIFHSAIDKLYLHRRRPSFSASGVTNFDSHEVVGLLDKVIAFSHARLDYSPSRRPRAIRIENDAFSRGTMDYDLPAVFVFNLIDLRACGRVEASKP